MSGLQNFLVKGKKRKSQNKEGEEAKTPAECMRRNWKGKDPKEKKRKKSGSRSPQSKSPHKSPKQKFEEEVKKKRDEFHKAQEKEKKRLRKKLKECQSRLAEIEKDDTGARRLIREKMMLEDRKLEVSRKIEEITSGVVSKEFNRKVRIFEREARRIRESAPATTKKRAKRAKSVVSSEKSSKETRRKSAGHNRKIKVSDNSDGAAEQQRYDVLMQEMEEEFGDDDSERTVWVALNNVCPRCGIQMQKVSSESILGCNQCGIMVAYSDSTAACTSHSDERSFSSFAYSRSGHFGNWLKTIQGKEGTTIPPEILHGVCWELARRRIQVKDVTPPRVRDCLKAMKKRKYYENSVLISSLLTGKPPQRFSPAVEKLLEELFLKIQEPYEKARQCIDPTRVNFLSYPYCAFKLLQLLDSSSVDPSWLNGAQAFPKLKGRDKLARADRIWQHICMQLNWKFYPSC